MADVTVTNLARLFGTNGLYHSLEKVTVFLETDVATSTSTVRIAGKVLTQKVGSTGPTDEVTMLDGGIQMDLTTAAAVAAAIEGMR